MSGVKSSTASRRLPRVWGARAGRLRLQQRRGEARGPGGGRGLHGRREARLACKRRRQRENTRSKRKQRVGKWRPLGKCHWNRAVGNDHFCDATERAFQRLVFIERGTPLCHRSGEKPLDPTTLHWKNATEMVTDGNGALAFIGELPHPVAKALQGMRRPFTTTFSPGPGEELGPLSR